VTHAVALPAFLVDEFQNQSSYFSLAQIIANSRPIPGEIGASTAFARSTSQEKVAPREIRVTVDRSFHDHDMQIVRASRESDAYLSKKGQSALTDFHSVLF
jgi:hypothetical protein